MLASFYLYKILHFDASDKDCEVYKQKKNRPSIGPRELHVFHVHSLLIPVPDTTYQKGITEIKVSLVISVEELLITIWRLMRI